MSYGIVEYNEEGKVKCEICNRFFHAVSRHTYHTHKLTALEYKKQFGFNTSRGLSSKSFKEVLKLQGQRSYAENPHCFDTGNRFVKGSRGRVKAVLSEQARLRLVESAKSLGISNVGNVKKAKLKRSRFEKELSMSYPILVRWCKNYYKENYDEDILSEAMCIVLEKKGLSLKRAKLITYLFSVTKNLYKGKFRERKNIIEVSLSDTAYDQSHEESRPENDILGESKFIWDLIYSLSPKKQVIIVAKSQGIKNSELCELLNCPPDYLKTLVWFIRNDLKLKLRDHIKSGD